MDWQLIAAETWWQWWITPSSWLYLFMMAAGLGVLIFVHEAGHFLVAKACGVKCEKFYLGFDIPIGKLLAWMFKREKEVTIFGIPIPRTFAKFRWGETEYGIGVLPLGGYVKMLGQDDNPAAAARERERSLIKKEEAAGNSAAAPEAANVGKAAASLRPETEAADGSSDGEEEYVLDPRSYQAKSVPQRMAIISAGVIMNLLTAPLFATAAYMMGVDYQPCVVGEVVPGGAAYEAGMRPRDRILQLGGHDNPYEHIRFVWDLVQGMAMVDEGQPLKVLIRRNDGTKEATIEKLTVEPQKYYLSKGKLAPGFSMGIVAAASNSLYEPGLEGLPAARANPALKKDDTIIGVRPVGEANYDPITNYFDLRVFLLRYADSELEFKLARETGKDKDGKPITQTVETKIKANKYRDVGLVMKPGPVSSIYPDSPAERAGFETGDRIKTVAGEVFGGEGIDPMLLTDFLRPHYGKPVAVQVERDGKPLTLEVVPETPEMDDIVGAGRGTPMSSAALGIAYPVTLTVDVVRPDTPAHKQGLRPGDVLTDIVFIPRKGKEDEKEELPNKGEPIELDERSQNWTWVFDILQSLPENDIKLSFKRGGKQQENVVLGSVELAAANPSRGLILAPLTQNQRASSLGEAFTLGLRETKENFIRVLVFLKKLVTGEIAATNLGGPLTIGAVATSEASQGASTLLLFMTFLSVNLAIVNFLPIPVLDGGHMMFLTYEAIRGKPADEKWLNGLTLIGFAFLICLMLFVFSLDIFRFAGVRV